MGGHTRTAFESEPIDDDPRAFGNQAPFTEVVCELRIVIEPPERRPSYREKLRILMPPLFDFSDGSFRIGRRTVVDTARLSEVETRTAGYAGAKIPRVIIQENQRRLRRNDAVDLANSSRNSVIPDLTDTDGLFHDD